MADTNATLWIVATPLGNPGDITLRAIETLRQVDAVICEERRVASTLLKRLDIHKELMLLNEHNEADDTDGIIQRLSNGQTLALISDCGTPVFADPGARLIRAAINAGIRVSPVPGPSSLAAALSLMARPLDQFVFGGFLPREQGERRRALTRLRDLGMPVVLMDTPYRLARSMAEVAEAFGDGCEVLLAIDLTLPGERVLRGRAGEVKRLVEGQKGEFVLVVMNELKKQRAA
ncbi:MAG: 16S rRNA (cytidine(1402)-2'-O)-methyltransferase [Anaerolineae bacterium]|nr:16S rRNA (cytidine(1402)-2'-O)-methyltransferase [Anaerolineae bacterium]